MKILVVSCDKSVDLFEPYYYCIEKYWPDHPEIIYTTETITNPYYRTICKNYPLAQYSKRIHDCLEELDDDWVMIMVDDIFIRSPVDKEELDYIYSFLDDIAAINLQQPFSSNDIPINDRLMIRVGPYKTSLMCQIWNREKALEVFDCNCDPWEFEVLNNHLGYTYLISTKYPINFGRPLTGGKWAIYRGKWTRECKEFFDKEGLEIDYSRRGFCD